jgi:succinate dehydrogenase / fumarate reductase membrane anchor subunit
MALRSEIGQVRGLGSARNGTHHWWMQRVTAIANVLLMIWLLASLVAGAAADHAVMVAWVGQPLTAVLLSLLVISLFYHVRLGLQVFIEDYVHTPGNKVAALIGATFFTVLAAALALFSILKIALAL